MPCLDRERQRELQRQWYQRNKSRVAKQTRENRSKRRSEYNKTQREYHAIKKEDAEYMKKRRLSQSKYIWKKNYGDFAGAAKTSYKLEKEIKKWQQQEKKQPEANLQDQLVEAWL